LRAVIDTQQENCRYSRLSEVEGFALFFTGIAQEIYLLLGMQQLLSLPYLLNGIEVICTLPGP
jgi:hypothetical protein